MPNSFSSPPNPVLFNAGVWAIVKQIPAGKVATYGQIAALLGPPSGMDIQRFHAFGARWVGGAMAACPDGIPWQRVINAKGEISVRPGHGANVQRELLEAEGVDFNERGRVDLKRFQWGGPNAA